MSLKMAYRSFTVRKYLMFFIVLLWSVCASGTFTGCSAIRRISNGNPDLTVQLSIFSGRPDPEWTVTSDNGNYLRIRNKLGNLSAGTLRSVLGYRGFVVRISPAGEPNTIRCIVSHTADKELQNMLLNTAPSNMISKPLKERIRQSINGPTP